MIRAKSESRPWACLAASASLFWAAACAAPLGSEADLVEAQQIEPPRPAPELSAGPELGPIPDSRGPALAIVAGDPVYVDEFLVHLLHRDSRLVFDAVDRIAIARLALLEAGRLEVRVDPAQVDQRLSEDQAEMVKMLEPSGMQLDRYLVEELGLNPNRYFEVLREEILQQLLTERVMRAWTLGQERTELSVIVTQTQAEMDSVQVRLGQGEDFAALAAELSVDPSRANGGVLPPVVRSELSPLSRLAFQTAVGVTGGPMEQDGHWILIRPDARPAPLSGPWSQISPAVEASLAAEPVADPEYWQWRSAMSRSYKIDHSPLLKLAGEPSAPDRP